MNIEIGHKLIVNLLDKIMKSDDISSLMDLKNLAVKNREYELGAWLRDVEVSKINKKEEAEMLVTKTTLVTPDPDASRLLIVQMYYELMKTLHMSHDEIDKLPFYIIQELYLACKSRA